MRLGRTSERINGSKVPAVLALLWQWVIEGDPRNQQPIQKFQKDVRQAKQKINREIQQHNRKARRRPISCRSHKFSVHLSKLSSNARSGLSNQLGITPSKECRTSLWNSGNLNALVAKNETEESSVTNGQPAGVAKFLRMVRSHQRVRNVRLYPLATVQRIEKIPSFL